MSSSISKIILITGANQGIGFEIARSLSAKAGYHVLLGSRNTERGIKAAKQLQEQELPVEPITIEHVGLYLFSCPDFSLCNERNTFRIGRVCCFSTTLLLETFSSAPVLR
jgi:hypothetical protein